MLLYCAAIKRANPQAHAVGMVFISQHIAQGLCTPEIAEVPHRKPNRDML